MSMITRLRAFGFALAAGTAMVALQPSAAMAQFWGYGSWYGRPAPWAPAPAYPRAYDEERLRPGEVADLLRGYGWTILSPPTISQGRYVAHVRTAFGQRMFVVLDAYDGRLLRTRQLDERPDTSQLAAIPGGVAPEGRIRAVPPEYSTPTPAPKLRRAAPQARRILPAPDVKSAPLAPPQEKEGTVAVAKPTTVPQATKRIVPTPATPSPSSTAPSSPVAKGTPEQGQPPVVRQVYPASGAAPAAPAANEAPQAAAAVPAKPPAKAVLPADAGFE
jgi:hypothetical protein